MNSTPRSDSRQAGIIVAIGVLVLLIGTATGSAIAMLAMSTVALVVMSIVFRKHLGKNALVSIAAAAAIAAAVAVAIANI